MDDPVLTSRLDALRNQLDVVSTNLASAAWQPQESRAEARAELFGESSLWTGLETTLIKEIRRHRVELDRIEEDLDKATDGDLAAASAAWVRYAKIQRDSQGLLRECLEIIGTLAIRTKDLDHKILHVADELIRDCMNLSTGDPHYYLLVHGMGDTFSKTRARIIRLRFPEWTVWDLPLAAHELGQVAMTEILVREQVEEDETLRTLTRFIETQRDAMLAGDPELNSKHVAGGDQAAEAERWAQSRVRILLADAFATYTMGPAYACAAIMLRLSPAVATSQRDVPSDGQRGHVILSVLRWMNDKEENLQKPYLEIIAHLSTAWQNTLNRSSPSPTLPAELQTQLDRLAEGFTREVSYLTLNGTAMFPHNAPNDGWRKAQEWSAAWLGQLTQRRPLAVPADAVGKLRDVLNAVWLSRLQIQKMQDPRRLQRELAEAAQSLCKQIMTTTRPEGSRVRTNAQPAAGG